MNIVTKNWRDLIRPRGVQVELEERDGKFHYGKFTCEPLERGYGITVGNSLRRVLLSSLQGAAITAIKIDGALHEFTTIDDVKEDVTDIILNLKEVVFQATEAKRYTLSLVKEGPGAVLAAGRSGNLAGEALERASGREGDGALDGADPPGIGADSGDTFEAGSGRFGGPAGGGFLGHDLE